MRRGVHSRLIIDWTWWVPSAVVVTATVVVYRFASVGAGEGWPTWQIVGIAAATPLVEGLLHEGGHVTAALLLGSRPRKLFVGATMAVDISPPRVRWRQMTIAAAGPLTSLGLLVVGAQMAWRSGIPTAVVWGLVPSGLFVLASICTSLFAVNGDIRVAWDAALADWDERAQEADERRRSAARGDGEHGDTPPLAPGGE